MRGGWTWFLLAAAWVFFGWPAAGQELSYVRPMDDSRQRETGTVLAIEPDGSLRLTTGERVKLIDVDVQDHAEEVVEFLEQYVGANVRLEYDAIKTTPEGSLWAYVFADGEFLNARIIEEGVAPVERYSPFQTHSLHLLELQGEAARLQLGIWAPAGEEPQEEGEDTGGEPPAEEVLGEEDLRSAVAATFTSLQEGVHLVGRGEEGLQVTDLRSIAYDDGTFTVSGSLHLAETIPAGAVSLRARAIGKLEAEGQSPLRQGFLLIEGESGASYDFAIDLGLPPAERSDESITKIVVDAARFEESLP